MSFDTYANLQLEIIDYLARDDLNAKVPSFITLTEAKLNRELYVRQMEAREVTNVDLTTLEPEFISLPDDFQSMRNVRLSSVTGKPSLEYLSGVALNELRTQQGDTNGLPKNFTIFGTEMELLPSPDQNYVIEMIYRQNIPPLASNATNWLLTLAPDVYLYGALLEAAPYTKNDARIQTWALGFSTALDSLNKLGMNSTYNAGPLQMTITGPTP